jgi:hypothetical protein
MKRKEQQPRCPTLDNESGPGLMHDATAMLPGLANFYPINAWLLRHGVDPPRIRVLAP